MCLLLIAAQIYELITVTDYRLPLLLEECFKLSQILQDYTDRDSLDLITERILSKSSGSDNSDR